MSAFGYAVGEIGRQAKVGFGSGTVLTDQRDPGRSGHSRSRIITPEIALKNSIFGTGLTCTLIGSRLVAELVLGEALSEETTLGRKIHIPVLLDDTRLTPL